MKCNVLVSHRMVFTFRSWFDLLCVVLAFWISILITAKVRTWVLDIPSFEKHSESSSGHTLGF